METHKYPQLRRFKALPGRVAQVRVERISKASDHPVVLWPTDLTANIVQRHILNRFYRVTERNIVR